MQTRAKILGPLYIAYLGSEIQLHPGFFWFDLDKYAVYVRVGRLTLRIRRKAHPMSAAVGRQKRRPE